MKSQLFSVEWVRCQITERLTRSGSNATRTGRIVLSRVKRGDLLVEFDRQAQIRNSLDQQAEYDKLVSQVAEEQAKEDEARAKNETELHRGWNGGQEFLGCRTGRAL